MRPCGNCGRFNPPRLDKCVECGHPFELAERPVTARPAVAQSVRSTSNELTYRIHEVPALDGSGATALEIETDGHTVAHVYPSEDMEQTAELFAGRLNAQAALVARVEELEQALRESLNAPFPEDMRLLIIGIGGKTETVKAAKELCDQWEARRIKARALLQEVK